jgi:rRNA-processing protein FCF1
MASDLRSNIQELIVIDTNILVLDPWVLTSYSQIVRLVIPSEVAREISALEKHGRVSHELLETMIRSIDSGFSLDPALIHVKPEAISCQNPRLSLVDISLIGYARALQATKRKTRIATEDRDLEQEANRQGIETVRLSALQRLLSSTAGFELSELRQHETIGQLQRRTLITGAVIGFLASSLFITGTIYAKPIAMVLGPWWLLILLPLAGVSFYSLRSHKPLSYGVAEIAVGLFTSGRLLIPGSPVSTYGPVQFLQIVGGIYIVVRGLDNISKGLKGRKAETIWKFLFGKNSI